MKKLSVFIFLICMCAIGTRSVYAVGETNESDPLTFFIVADEQDMSGNAFTLPAQIDHVMIWVQDDRMNFLPPELIWTAEGLVTDEILHTDLGDLVFLELSGQAQDRELIITATAVDDPSLAGELILTLDSALLPARQTPARVNLLAQFTSDRTTVEEAIFIREVRADNSRLVFSASVDAKMGNRLWDRPDLSVTVTGAVAEDEVVISADDEHLSQDVELVLGQVDTFREITVRVAVTSHPEVYQALTVTVDPTLPEIQAGVASAPIYLGGVDNDNQQISVPIVTYNIPDGTYPATFGWLPEGVSVSGWAYERGAEWTLKTQGYIVVEAGKGEIVLDIDHALINQINERLHSGRWMLERQLTLSMEVDSQLLPTTFRLETVMVPAEIRLINPTRVLPSGRFLVEFQAQQFDANGSWIAPLLADLSWSVVGLSDEEAFEVVGWRLFMELADLGIERQIEVTAYLTDTPEIRAIGTIDIQPNQQSQREQLQVEMNLRDIMGTLELSPDSKGIMHIWVNSDRDTHRLAGEDVQIHLESDNPADFVTRIDDISALIYVGDAQEAREVTVVVTLAGDTPQTFSRTIVVSPAFEPVPHNVTLEAGRLTLTAERVNRSIDAAYVNIFGLPAGVKLTPQGRDELSQFRLTLNDLSHVFGFVDLTDGVAQIELDTRDVPAGTYEVVVHFNADLPASTHVINLVVE